MCYELSRRTMTYLQEHNNNNNKINTNLIVQKKKLSLWHQDQSCRYKRFLKLSFQYQLLASYRNLLLFDEFISI